MSSPSMTSSDPSSGERRETGERDSTGEEPGTELSPSTQRVYRAGWRDFVGWSRQRDTQILPADPESVAAFLEERQDMALSTIRNRMSAIQHYHKVSGLDDPTSALVVSNRWHKISEEKRGEEGRRSGSETAEVSFPPGEILRHGPELLEEYFDRSTRTNEELREKRRRAEETWTDQLIETDPASSRRLTEAQRRLIPEVEYDLVTLRDRALFLLMAAGGARRAEVVRLDVTDVVPFDDAILVGIRKKNGMPKRVLWAEPEEELRYCSARAVAAWILTAGIYEGPLFRSFDAHKNLKRARISLSSVNYRLGQLAEEAELDPDEWPTGRLRDEPEA